MILDFARSLPVEPGSNLRGEQADTTWLFLLRSLELDEVLIVGSAPSGTILAFTGLARRVTIVRPSPIMRLRIRRLARREPVAGGVTMTRRFDSRAPDLVYIAPSRTASLARNADAVSRLSELVASGGCIYSAPHRRRRGRGIQLARRLGVKVAITLGRTRKSGRTGAMNGAAAWLVPAEAPTALPVTRGIRRAGRVLRRLAPVSLRRNRARVHARLSEPEESLRVVRVGELPGGPQPRAGTLIQEATGNAPGRLPDYLATTAAAAGHPLRSSGWRLAPPRGYRSQKVIFFAALETGAPVVVKLTQESRFNRLLDNEAAALAHFAALGPIPGVSVPGLRFHSTHAGLSVVAQDALRGHAFVRAAPARPDSDEAKTVADAFLAIAMRSRAPATDIGDALLDVVERYESLYQPPARRMHALKADARLLAALEGDLPTVFMHGDSTVYNILLAEQRAVGLVDWENAEPAGIPLWDVFHFMQSHAVWIAEQAGTRYTPERCAHEFAGAEAPILRSDTVRGYCGALELPDETLAPLVRIWLARHAVREARQLPREQLGRGFYHRALAAADEA